MAFRIPALALGLALAIVFGGPAFAQPAPDPPRTATPPDVRLLDTTYAPIKLELNRMGLHRAVGKTCTAFITADSVRPVETPLPLDGGTVTLPYASFLIWSADRPFADAMLYHVFSTADARYTQPVRLPAGTTPANTAYAITLAKREPYPSEHDLAVRHDGFAGPFVEVGAKGAAKSLAVRPTRFQPRTTTRPASCRGRRKEP